MKAFVTKPIPEVGIKMIRDAGHEVYIHEDAVPLPQEALIAACQSYDALLSAGMNRIDAHFLESCRHLKVVSLFSVGYDNVDIGAASRLKIPVGHTPDVLSRATADLAFLLMIAVSRKAFFNYKKILDGQWSGFEPIADLGQELYGKTLGVFGLGKIGYEMAKKCQAAFDMNIIYHNRTPSHDAATMLGARYVDFETLLRQSDVLSLHANFTPETSGRFNMDAFSKMKSHAIFVNTARGGLHNEADLKAALETGMIWGAGLDVTNPEPMEKDNALLRMPSVCVLPHIGSATREARDGMAELAARNIIAAFKGERLPTIVNPDIYQ